MNTQNPNFHYGNSQNINQFNHQSNFQNLNPQYNNLKMNIYTPQIPQNNIFSSNNPQTSKSNNFIMGYNNNNIIGAMNNNNQNNFNNNINVIPYSQNNNINLPSINNNNNYIENDFRPYSGNDLLYAKELKQRKQEEYRKILDEQIQSVNQRKENDKIKYKNYESNSSFLNLPDNNNKTITKPYIDDKQKEIERKKKMEYNEILRQQVEERKKREEMEKQKQKEEDIKFEVKIQKQLEERKIQEEYHKKLESLGKHNKNMESPDNIMYTNNPIPNNNTIEQQLFSSSPPPNLYLQNTLNNNNNATLNNNLNNYTQVSSFPAQYIQQQMFNQNNNFQGNNYPNNNNNYNQNEKIEYLNNQTYQPNNNYYGQRPLTQYHPTLNNNEFFDSPNTSNNNFTRTQSTRIQSLNYNTLNNNNNQINKTSNINIEELFEKYVNDCQNLISQYEITMENFPFNPSLQKDNNDTIRALINEKDKFNNQIQSGQEELKNCLGFYPNLSEFNMKITKYLSLVLDRKIREIQEISKNYQNNKKKYDNYLNPNKNINLNNNYQNINNQNQIRKNENNNFNSNINSLTVSQINKQIIGCQYRSKYEDLRKSIFKNEDLNHDLKESLSGWSKLVTPQSESFIKNNPNINSNNFYQTWKCDNNNVNSSGKNLDKIDEEDKKENEINYNIPEDQLLMSKKFTENKKVSRRESKKDNENILNNNNNIRNSNIKSKNSNINNNNIKSKNSNSNIDNIKNKTSNSNINVNNINNIKSKNSNLNLKNQTIEKNIMNTRGSINSSKMSNKDNNISMEQIESSIKNINKNNINITTSKKLDPRISAKIMDEKNLKISKEEKDKSVYFVGQEQNSIMNNTNKIENSNLRISNELKNRKSYHGSQENINNITRNINSKDNYIINDLEDDNCNILSKDINFIKKSNKEEEEEEKYENDFTIDNNIIKNLEAGENNQKKINLNDYKEIHESQKLQNQLNFFEDSILDNKVNIKNSNKQKIRPSSPKGKNSQIKKIENENNNNNNNNEKNQVDSLLSSNNNFCNDSYGDNIINDLNKFRKLALEESSISNYKK